MIKIKPGVKITGMKPEMILGLMAATEAYREMGYDTIVTSVMDGTHKVGSRHYSGLAVDLRIRHMERGKAAEVRDKIHEAVGLWYDVILENSHIHIEYDPKHPV